MQISYLPGNIRGEEYYQLGKAREKEGDLTGAIAFYKKAERLGHPLCEPDLDRSTGYCPPSYTVPTDPEDSSFLQSFDLDQATEIKEVTLSPPAFISLPLKPPPHFQFFEKYGFVIIRDVLTKEECTATVDEIWDYVEKKGFVDPSYLEMEKALLSSEPYRLSRHDPTTWIDFRTWPPLQHEGIVGSRIVWWPQALRNRQNPNIHKVYFTFNNPFSRLNLLL